MTAAETGARAAGGPQQDQSLAGVAALARVSWSDTLWLALLVGLMAGIAEIAVALFKTHALHRFVWLSRDVFWMAPLAAVFFLLIPGVLLSVLARLRRSLSIAWVVAALVSLAFFSLLLAAPRIALYASALVALGIGVRMGASARKSPNAWRRASRTWSLVLAAFVALLGVGERAWRWGAERAVVANLGASPEGAPNVLLIIFDTVRRANLSLYGYQRPTTPNLEKRAREGAVFDFAMSTAPWTLPSHASIFTGRYPDQTMGDWRRPVDAAHRTLAEALQERGYATAGFVDNLLYTSYESGLDQGFAHYADYPVTFPLILRHFALGRSALVSSILQSRSLYELRRALLVFNLHKAREGADEPPVSARRTRQFLEWERRRGERPFFAFINLFEAHGLFTPTPEEERLFPGGRREDYYDAAIFRLDRAIGSVLDSLQQRGVLENTIVVITSDHGEHFGEHGLDGHANSLYLQLLRVPLLIRYPREVPVRRLSEPVSLRDLPATILDLAGLRDSTFPGSSLTRFWRGSADTSFTPLIATLSQGINVVPASRNAKGSLASILTNEYHFIRGPGDHEELFAYHSDSLETSNIVSRAPEPELRQLRAALVAMIDSLAEGVSRAAAKGRP